LDEVYALVLASGAVHCFRQSDRYDYPRMWRRAMDCARNAMAIARACGPSQKPCLFGAALLHDVGRMALMEAVPERYARIPKETWGNELLAVEEEALGITHLEAGYVLASNWALPVQMVEPIRFHHTVHFAKRVKDVTAVVCVASALTELTQDGSELRDRRLIEECGEVLSLLGLGGDTLAAIARQNASR
jgi:HD-like signal output (HDOD) protein